MDVHIESINYDNASSLEEYYHALLTRKFGHYPFIKKVELKLEAEKDLHVVSLRIGPENGKIIFASDAQVKKNKAYQNTIRKVEVMIEKYKQVHYRSMQKRKTNRE